MPVPGLVSATKAHLEAQSICSYGSALGDVSCDDPLTSRLGQNVSSYSVICVAPLLQSVVGLYDVNGAYEEYKEMVRLAEAGRVLWAQEQARARQPKPAPAPQPEPEPEPEPEP